MAASISPVPRIWQSVPSISHGKKTAFGHGTVSPVAMTAMAKKITENGKPNRKRILVAPQVPSGPVNCRCIALRVTCPSAATMVKGIQSEAMLNMGGFGQPNECRGTVKGVTGAVNLSYCMRHQPRCRPCETRGDDRI